MTRKKRIAVRLICVPAAILLILAGGFFVYTQNYYHAAPEAEAALSSTENVKVEETAYGWFFDGPSEENALIFYPGGKVEEISYAPLLRTFAENGLDVCLVKMPFRLAVFGINKASAVMEDYEYEHWYIGGHSLGGSMAAYYASSRSEALDGVILLAAYPSKKLDDSLSEVLIYGSNDRVLNMDNVRKGREYAPARFTEHVIEGGNHASFGNYGAQKGDGPAEITAEQQQSETVGIVIQAAGIQ